MAYAQKRISTTPDYSSYDVQGERQNLAAFLAGAGLWIPKEFFGFIRSGDVIDLYENPPSMKQLYCNTQFKQLCSYSDEQMASVPFPQLFWRSDEVQNAIVKQAMSVALHGSQAEKWDVPPHELIENFHPQKRTFQVNLGWIAPCFSLATNERVAFVSSLNVEFIFEWPIPKTS